MSELSIEYAAALEREKELGRRYDELFNFMQSHVKESQVSLPIIMYYCDIGHYTIILLFCSAQLRT